MNPFKFGTIVDGLLLLAASMTMNAKTLVAYFSATGVTKAAAEQIAAEQNADLWEIVPYEPYTAADLDWRNDQSRSSLEMKDPAERPMIKMCTDISSYDTIYLGFPIWWNTCPRIINSWIDNNDLTGKRVILFYTSGSSTIDGALNDLRTIYPQYNWEVK